MTTADPQQPSTPDTRSYAALRYPASRMYLGGAALAMMEAMKMEHTLKAPAPGTVDQIGCRDGDQVEEGVLLISLDLD